MRTIMLAIVAFALATPAAATEDMSAAEFFARDKVNNWTGDLSYGSFGSPYGRLVHVEKLTPQKQEVAKLIAKHVSNQIGEKWVDTALRLAKIESGFNCAAKGPRTRHGNAKGLFQLLDKSAITLGFDPKDMYSCDKNILAGVAHMKACIDLGKVSDSREMAACHVAGWANWNVKLARRPERYKQRYVTLTMK